MKALKASVGPSAKTCTIRVVGRFLRDAASGIVGNAAYALLLLVSGLVAAWFRDDIARAVHATAVTDLAGAVGVAALVIVVPLAVLGMGRRTRAEQLSQADPTNVVIRVVQAAPDEPWLEWLHLEAENLGGQRAEDAWIQLRISGMLGTWRLMWSGAHETTTLQHGLPVAIPLLIRANEDHPNARIYGNRLPPCKAVLTDINFLKDHRIKNSFHGMPQRPWEGRFDVTLFYGDGASKKASFNVHVPHESDGGRMSIYQVI